MNEVEKAVKTNLQVLLVKNKIEVKDLRKGPNFLKQ